MESGDKIINLKKEIDRELQKFLDGKAQDARKNDMPPEFVQAVENVRDFVLRGGKRLRPILFCYGYESAGGKIDEKVVAAAIAVELLHIYLLIHDDIIDRDEMRHGGASMHKKYERDYLNEFHGKDLEHFGISMAINIGDMAASWSYEILAKADFENESKNRAISKLSQIIEETLVGQMLDGLLEMEDIFDEERIRKVQDYKTARYTIRGPLQLGAIMAGADEEELSFISSFSIPLGIAYQIQDDIIGLFGEEEKTGKPVGSDIREGKKTLLISYALNNSSGKDRELILSCLGQRDLGKKEILGIRELIKEKGSIEYSRGKIEELMREFKERLRNGPNGLSSRYAFLEDFAENLMNRDK